jgi:hypothetical protein
MGKGERGIIAALDRIRAQLPFPLRGIHSDNGSEFINEFLLAWSRARGVEFTRGRPNHKNDNPHVEQKNGGLVSRYVGYERLDSPAQMAWLDRLYTQLLRPFNNCVQPVIKLIGRDVVDGRTRKLYDRPTTPFSRVIASGVSTRSQIDKLAITYTKQSPLQLKREIDRTLAALPATLGTSLSA